MKPHVTVTSQGNGTFRVEVKGQVEGSVHTVTVPEGLADLLGWRESEEELVRESFGFLLEREPASSILPSFSLDVIGRYFPEYPAEIRLRNS